MTEFVSRLRDLTCGELSCDECNADREHAADEIERLTEELARTQAIEQRVAALEAKLTGSDRVMSRVVTQGDAS